MITAKHIDRFVIAVIASSLLLCFLPLIKPGMSGVRTPAITGTEKAAAPAEYEKMLFDPAKPITVDLIIDADQWKHMLENASEKKWQSCDVIINGTRFHNVGIRPKGDSSLSSIAEAPNSNRYSFKLKFDKYEEGQKCWGLDKLCLNNNYGDITNMKEAFVYDMFRYLGADAPLYNYAKITVNGNYWGVYLALEAVDQAFLQRNYGSRNGALYKPGAGKGQEGGDEWADALSEGTEENAGTENSAYDRTDALFENAGEGGAELKYIDDHLDSYWGIWPCQITKTDDADHRRVVEALKNIGDKKDLETYMDVDNVLRYMAVHNFSVNNDSLSGDGAHNYYLYETGGKLNLIPWDYNLCFGAYEMDWGRDDFSGTPETSSEMINKPIDDPWALTTFFDGLLGNEEYRSRYHKVYRQLIDSYVLGGGFDVFYSRTRAQIDELVKNDPNALYSYESYDAAARMLKQAVMLRGQSIKGQLEGTIPSTSLGQKAHPDRLINADAIDLTVMGSDSVEAEPGESRASEEAFSEENWEALFKEYLEQQKRQREDTVKKNTLHLGLSFLILTAGSFAAASFRRRGQ
jgi:spore coat protein CotH